MRRSLIAAVAVLVGLLVVPSANAAYKAKTTKLVGKVAGDSNSKVVVGLKVKPFVSDGGGPRLNVTARDVLFIRYANVNESCSGTERSGRATSKAIDFDGLIFGGNADVSWLGPRLGEAEGDPYSFDGRNSFQRQYPSVYPDASGEPDGVVTRRLKSKRPWRISAIVAMNSGGGYGFGGGSPWFWYWECTKNLQFKASGRMPKF
jgi:hypothetical protein